MNRNTLDFYESRSLSGKIERRRINRFYGEKRNIAIFGTGSGTMKVIPIIGAYYENVKFLIDYYPKLNKFCNRQVFSIHDCNVQKIDGVIIASDYWGKM